MAEHNGQYCIACEKPFIRDGNDELIVVSMVTVKPWGVCQQCRADLELGKMVRAMPVDHSIERQQNFWYVVESPMSRYVVKSDGDTPEAALKAAKGEGQ